MNRLNKLLEDVKKELNLNYNIKIRIKPQKRKIASISLTNKIIYINKNLLPHLNEEEIKFILAHELLHLKYGKYHTNEFEQELSSLFPNKETLLMNIINKLKN